MELTPKHTRVLLRAALFAVLAAVLTHTRADPDLFGNIRFGADVFAARSPIVPDAYSFTGAGTFMNHEWLSEALLYLVYNVAGSAGLIAVKLGLLAAVAIAVLMALRGAGVPSGDADLLLALAAVATFPQTNQVRAQLFSLALFAGVLLALTSSRRNRRALLWLVPMMAVWPNLHGGWIVALGTLVVWTIGEGLTSRSLRGTWLTGAAVAAALAATVLNPWGWRMWTFLYETVGVNRADIRDWQPAFRLGPAYGALWLLVAATALAGVVAAIRERHFDLAAFAIVAMLGVAAFRVSRLTAFFALSTVMLLGPHAATWLTQLRRGREPKPQTRFAAGLAAAVAFVIIAGAGTVSARNLSCIWMEEPLFPEPELASVVRQQGLHGRLLNWFDYGHYAIWYFTPALKVSIDGRRETLYSKETIDRHLSFFFSPSERQAAIDALAPDYIWMPSTLDVTWRLIADGWQPVFKGPQSTLLANPRNAATAPAAVDAANVQLGSSNLPRCFPGP